MRLPPWLHRLVLGVVVVAVLVVAAVAAGGGDDGASLSTGPSSARAATIAAAESSSTAARSAQNSPTTTGRSVTPSETSAVRPPTTKTPTTKTPTTKTPTTKTPTTRGPTATPARSGLAVVALSSLPDEATDTWLLILDGGPFPYDRDGVTFQNRERLLPDEARGYYREYTVPTPGEDDRGARRLVVGGTEEIVFYTGDHYDSFVEVDVGR